MNRERLELKIATLVVGAILLAVFFFYRVLPELLGTWILRAIGD
jgi:hypothetical protein